MKNQPKITHVAIKDRDGKIWALPKPNRHHDVIHKMYVECGKEEAHTLLGNHEQGFLVDGKDFLLRLDAWYVAYNAGQLLPPFNPLNPNAPRQGKIDDTPGVLFSEDLW